MRASHSPKFEIPADVDAAEVAGLLGSVSDQLDVATDSQRLARAKAASFLRSVVDGWRMEARERAEMAAA